MTDLLSRDYDQVLQAVRELHVPCTLAEFPHRVMAIVPQLVRSERTAYNEVNLSQNRITALIHPNQPSAEEIGAWLQPHLSTHPLISHVERTGDTAPRAISDFWSRSRYHRSAIYNECYRYIGVEDQLALPFGPERQVIVAVTLNRSRRTFSPRDRAVLTLLRPHLTQAYLSAAHSTALQNEVATRSMAWEAMKLGATKRGAMKIGAMKIGPMKIGPMKIGTIGCGALSMRPDGSIAFCSGRAVAWLRFLCPCDGDTDVASPRDVKAPAALRDWVRACHENPSRAAPLHLGCGPATLQVRWGGKTPDGTLLLLKEVETPERHAPSSNALTSNALTSNNALGFLDALNVLGGLGLTRRQSEVAWWLAQGESNAQISQRLELSPHTIKRHLEAIFGRLGVQNRNAAAYRAQQALCLV